MKTLVFVGAFVQLLVPCSAVIKQCYYPDGSPSSDFPCDPNAKESACCGSGLGSTCLSNRLCQSNNGNIIRGSCSDKDWSSPACAPFCLGADTGGTDLISCSNVTNADNSFCCDHTNGCCDSGAGRFNVLPRDPDVFATWNNEASSYRVVGTVYTGNPTSTSSAPAKTTSTTAATTTSSAPTNTSPPNDSDQSSGLSNGAKIGIGVGVGVGVVLLAAIAFLVWKLRQRKASSMAVRIHPLSWTLEGRRTRI
ncbi:hypothetical protein BBK36DRAFT_1170536 [Trichoderma citrinoviride]|uniref:Mid2 domain-containing protein n=1 Tax=Trichoderma citrinoviride TaxID=58853 RepID=A0A2T4B6A1_9HYPO|nr:hypothetical protein BBK36DRAFT_1170536 [Trichoderma citrinoviride]PTB64867.1 hypothetical protein BBK36DRAFT_1170536 [Trichoderma citrinoviride]